MCLTTWQQRYCDVPIELSHAPSLMHDAIFYDRAALHCTTTASVDTIGLDRLVQGETYTHDEFQFVLDVLFIEGRCGPGALSLY